MQEPGVLGTWIYNRSQPQLLDAVEALHERMLYDVEKQPLGYFDKPKYGIVDYFTGVHPILFSSASISICSSLAFCAATSAKSLSLLA